MMAHLKDAFASPVAACKRRLYTVKNIRISADILRRVSTF